MKLARAAPMAVFDGLSYRELLELIMLANANVPAAMRIEVRTQVFRKQVSSHAWGVETYIKRLREEVQEGKQVGRGFNTIQDWPTCSSSSNRKNLCDVAPSNIFN
jgi:hypothetical protein